MFVYTLCLTIVSVLAFGLAPALQATAGDLSSALKGDDTLFGTHIRRSGFRDALISAQVAACLVLLGAAGTLVKNLRDAAHIDTGLDTRRVTVAHLGLAATGHVTPALARARRELADRVAAAPGVAAAALVLQPPFSPWSLLHVSDVGRGSALHGVFYNAVTPRYFDLVRQRIVSGRAFSVDDSAAGARVAIVTMSAARILWPGRVALGQSLRIASAADSAGRIVRVVGVVADARSGMIWDGESTGYVYLPATSADMASQDVSLLVRSDEGARDVSRPIADIARDVDPDAPLSTTRLSDSFVLQLLPYRYAAMVASGVGALGIALAVLGLYGVVAFAVAQRRREIAIHVAMGAAPRDVLTLVLRREMRLVVRGLAIGLLLAFGEARLLGSLVIPLSPLGIGALALLAVALAGVAAIATVAPGAAALRIAPMQVLRQE
jgi:predicted permease